MNSDEFRAELREIDWVVRKAHMTLDVDDGACVVNFVDGLTQMEAFTKKWWATRG